MSERRTCRWCSFFEALVGKTHCSLCAPFLTEQAEAEREVSNPVQDPPTGGTIQAHPNEVSHDDQARSHQALDP